MKFKAFYLFTVIALVFGMLATPVSVSAAPKPPDVKPIDIGPELREWEATPDRISGSLGEADAEAAEAAAAGTDLSECTLDTKYFLALDDYQGRYVVTAYNLVADGAGAQIWVQANLAWPAGDPRPTPVITCEQVSYMLGEFEGNILPTETDFFGPPMPLDGSYAYLPSLLGLPDDYYYDEAGRTIIMVSNVRDDQYYDPTYPYYIAGFYSPSYEVYFDRNIITIDSLDWANRTGPDGTRPYLYEGTVAHEYQHLLHDDYDSDEDTFVNEGMSELAEFLTGYGHPDSHVEEAAEKPENSLVVWEDQGDLEILSDYGHAYLFQYYLMEKFGQGFIQAQFHNQGNGIAGVDATLSELGIDKTFAEIYHDWAVALLIDSTKYQGQYGFSTFDFKLDIGTPAAPNPEAYDKPGAPPWGTDYIWLDVDKKDVQKLIFNGVEYSMFPTSWTSDGEVLWSGTGDLVDNWAIFEATGGGTLTFDTLYDLEDYWDFGFVQVSTDGGYTWTSLANEYTTGDYDPNALPKVIENLPGLTSYITAWMPMSYDLSAYAGQDILIAFRLVTDWSTHYDGWYIDNVYVDDTLISDGTDASVFKDLTEIIPINNDFTVTFVSMKPRGNGNMEQIRTIKLSEATEEGWAATSSLFKNSRQVAMLVTYDAPEGITTYADYSFDFVYKTKGPKKK
ncbi:choice-of-anchor J domain-containing protein [Ornatilinea apprima]|uniref:choice-of-anchor J domain-containing protein n=1 Tax=Ornatilinea apprima TaxID=1134406 RepID=UPI00094684CA|nr:choice-of-anchor J domain-containing protein [Ornatilinea apprima]